MFDWSVNLGNLLTLGALVCSVAIVVGMLRNQVVELTRRMLAMEESMKQLVQVLIDQGRQEERMTAIDGRMLAQGARLDDLNRQIGRLFEPKSP